MATLSNELSLHLQEALVACGEIGCVISDAVGDDQKGAMAVDCAGRLERVAAKIRASVARVEAGQRVGPLGEWRRSGRFVSPENHRWAEDFRAGDYTIRCDGSASVQLSKGGAVLGSLRSLDDAKDFAEQHFLAAKGGA